MQGQGVQNARRIHYVSGPDGTANAAQAYSP